jgi:hypothetical protein
MVRLLLAALLLAALALTACGGSADIARDVAKDKDPDCWIESDVEKAGVPCLIRCSARHRDTPSLRSWAWEMGKARLVKSSADGSVVWISIDEPGVHRLTATGTDENGDQCVTPVHKIKCAKGLNAAPVVACEPADGQEPPDFPFAKEGARYHEWRWNLRCYDPDDPAFRCASELEIARGGLRGHDVILIMDQNGGVKIAPDLDGDGEDDDCDGRADRTFDSEHVFRVRCPIKSKEDVYVWKVTASSSSGKKEFKGHVTLMK